MSTKTRATRPHFHLPKSHAGATRTRPSPTVPSGTPPTRRDQRPRLLHLLIPVLVAILGVAVLWIAVGQGTQPEAPPTPGVTQFDSEVPTGIDGSDWHLYLRAQEHAVTLQAQQESAYGSDRRLYNRAAEITAAEQALQESAYGSDRRLYNMAAER